MIHHRRRPATAGKVSRLLSLSPMARRDGRWRSGTSPRGHPASPGGWKTAASGADHKEQNGPAGSRRGCSRMQTGSVFSIPRDCGQATFFRCFLETGLVLTMSVFPLIVNGMIDTVRCAPTPVSCDFPTMAAAPIGPRGALNIRPKWRESGEPPCPRAYRAARVAGCRVRLAGARQALPPETLTNVPS